MGHSTSSSNDKKKVTDLDSGRELYQGNRNAPVNKPAPEKRQEPAPVISRLILPGKIKLPMIWITISGW
jgi:hypothetical protein